MFRTNFINWGPTAETLKLMRETVALQLAEVYPQFAREVFGIGENALTP